MMIFLCFAKLAGFHGFHDFPGYNAFPGSIEGKKPRNAEPEVQGEVSDGGDDNEEMDEVFRER